MIAGPSPAPPSASVLGVCVRFLRRARPYAGRILVTLLVVLAATGAKTVQSYLLRPVIDLASGATPRAAAPGDGYSLRAVLEKLVRPAEWDLDTIITMAVVLAIAMFVFGLLRDYMTSWLRNRMLADLRNDVVEHLSYLPLRFHHDRKSGDLVSRVTNDVAVCDQATDFLFDDAIVHPLTILWALAGAFYANWKLAAAACALLPVYGFVLARLGRKMRKARKMSLEHLGDMTGTMIQTFGGIKVVKAFNTEAQQVREFREHNETYFKRLMATILRKASGENMNALFGGLGLALVLAFGYGMIQRREVTAGQLAFCGLAFAMINSSVRELSKSYNRLLETSAGAERVFQLLDTARDPQHDAGDDLPQVSSVEFKDVTFSYAAEPVLRGVTLAVKPGEVVAVVGRSGAGKTTLCDLLCRFYDPQGGEVRVSGADLRRVRRSSLLGHVAVVTQDTFLFNTTIGENIRYGRRGASQAEVEAAAKAAHVHEFIAGLERGYDTVVGERGSKLSGGQRQRIAIARAVLRDPSILILDEATNALDAESERAVQQALDGLLRSERRITFVIAHRLSTVKGSDRIVVLEDGRLVEEGRHDDLLARNGVYAALYRTGFAS
jgi:subfamily B ATP-binding cassette protein MsbA